MITVKICLIGLPASFIPLTSKNTFAANTFKCLAQTPDSCKKINKIEEGRLGGRIVQSLSRHSFQLLYYFRIRIGLSPFPPVDGPFTFRRQFGESCYGNSRLFTELGELRYPV